MIETYSLVVLLGFGRIGGPLPIADYDTEAQCIEARVAAESYWNETHPAGYKVKFGAECILTVTPSGGD